MTNEEEINGHIEVLAKRITILQAYLDGKKIQKREDHKWVTIAWLTDCRQNVEHYRIKPEPGEIWVAGSTVLIRSDEIAAYTKHHPDSPVTKYREVLDDE